MQVKFSEEFPTLHCNFQNENGVNALKAASDSLCVWLSPAGVFYHKTPETAGGTHLYTVCL